MVNATYLTGGLENIDNQTDENFIGNHPNIHAYQKLKIKWDFGMSGDWKSCHHPWYLQQGGYGTCRYLL